MLFNWEVSKAKEAVVKFLSEAYWPNFNFGGKAFNDYYKKMLQFANPVPLRGGRIIHGKPVDFYSPSFWHVCCAILCNWAESRSNSKGGTPKVYRGQTNPWQIRPSLWRNNTIFSGVNLLDIFRTFLLSEIPEYDPSLEFYPAFTDIKGITAIAQHHEFPTNFIDFTFNPLVALYFASLKDSKATFKDNQIEGHGVIYESYFSNFCLMQQRCNLKIVLPLLPAAQVPRLHQQQGFFVEFSNSINNTETEAIELPCEKYFFPRKYPINGDSDEVFSENQIMQHMGQELENFGSRMLNVIERNWYLAFDYYSEAFKALKELGEKKTDIIDLDNAISFLKEKTKNHYPPWDPNYSLGRAKNNYGLDIGNHLSKTALWLYDVCRVFGNSNSNLDVTLIKYYARENPAVIAAILKVAEKIELFSLPEIANEILQIDGIKVLTENCLSVSQSKKLNDLEYIRHN